MKITSRNSRQSLLRWSFAAVLSSFLWSSCQSEAPEAVATQEVAVTYDVPLKLDLSAIINPDVNAPKSQGRALDFVVNGDESTGINPRLEPSQLEDPNGVTVNLIFVCTDDDTQPVSIVPTKVYYDKAAGTTRLLRSRDHYSIQLASGTDLTRGTWVMAIYYGPAADGGTVTVDPNNLEAVKPASDIASDKSIDDVWNAGKSNLKKIVLSARGATTLAENEKVSLDIPFLSDWIPLAGKLSYPGGPSVEPLLTVTGAQLYAQGTLMRVRMHNQGFGDIRLAGFRILTNSMSFRGSYDFSAASLRTQAKSGKDLSTLYTPQDALGRAYADSVGRTLAYPNYADFWVNKDEIETLANNSSSNNYYLIWGMPRRSATNDDQSRRGILHLLAYDANRMGTEYNNTRTPDGYGIIPKALIRKPALTRAFDANFFRLSSGTQSGTFYRFDGVQTPIYNFLDYMNKITTDKHPTKDVRAGYYTKAEMEAFNNTSSKRVATKADWAGIFPTKLPDNGGPVLNYSDILDHYFVANTNAAGKVFSSNRYNNLETDQNIFDASGRAILLLTLDESDGNPPHPSTPVADRAKAGKANNRQSVHLPKEMKVPTYRNGQIQATTASDETLLFSVYNSNGDGGNLTLYYLTGWGQGQTYLTATAYKWGDDWRIKATSRYLGPAYHRPYGGEWAKDYPWDITFYLWGNRYTGANPRTNTEAEDTHRDLLMDGYQLNGERQRSGDRNSGDTMMYWSADGNWVYIYPNKINDRYVGSGYGAPANAPRTEIYTDAQAPGALIRTFSDTPVMPRQ